MTTGVASASIDGNLFFALVPLAEKPVDVFLLCPPAKRTGAHGKQVGPLRRRLRPGTKGLGGRIIHREKALNAKLLECDILRRA